MINIDEAETLVKTLGVEFEKYETDEMFKLTIFLGKSPEKRFIINCLKKIENTENENDCAFTFFVDKEYTLGDFGVFADVIDGLKKYLKDEACEQK